MAKRNIFAAEWFVYSWDEATVLGERQRTFLRGDRMAARVPFGIDPQSVMVAGDPPAKPFAWTQPIAELPGDLHLLVTDEALLEEIMSPAGRQGALGDMDPDRDSRPMQFRPPSPRCEPPTPDPAFRHSRPMDDFEIAAILFVVAVIGIVATVGYALMHR